MDINNFSSENLIEKIIKWYKFKEDENLSKYKEKQLLYEKGKNDLKEFEYKANKKQLVGNLKIKENEFSFES